MTVKTVPLGLMQANCYLVFDEENRALVIDPGDHGEKLTEKIKELGLNVEAVVLTHVHFDHIMAAETVCTAFHAPLLAGEKDADALTDAHRNLTDRFGHRPLSLHADRLLSEGDKVNAGNLSFTVLETPGHTPGSICLYDGKTLFSGDTLFCGTIGRTDFPGGNGEDMQASLRRLAQLPSEVTVYPGHDAPTTIGREKQINDFMRE